MNHPIPDPLALLVTRVRAAVHELAAARARLTSRKNVPLDVTGGEEDAMLERERAIGAMNALEFEIAPALADLDLQAVVNEVAATAVQAARDQPPRERHIMSSGNAVATTCSISWLPPRAMRIDEIQFLHPERWLIRDLRIGDRSQFDRPTPAVLIHSQLLQLDVAQTAMDIVIDIEYRGDHPAGEEFFACLIGMSDRPMDQAEARKLLRAWQEIAATEPFVSPPIGAAPVATVITQEAVEAILRNVHAAADAVQQRHDRFMNDDGFGNVTTEGEP